MEIPIFIMLCSISAILITIAIGVYQITYLLREINNKI